MALKDIFANRRSSRASPTAISDSPTFEKTSVDEPLKDTLQPIAAQTEDGQEYPTGAKLFVIIAGLAAGVLLIALDQTIVATAIPKITNQFHSVQDIGWYGSAYFLTAAALTTIWGKIYQNFNIKYWFCATVGIFELGSLICGVANDSVTLIVGRAIAGLGVSGIFSGALIIVAHEVPLEKRSAYIGLLGAVYGISSIIGPLIGGAFTQRVTWRWCFYINLPVGALTIAAVLFFVNIKQAVATKSLKERLLAIDLYGASVFIPAIICLILALQWGGSTHPWNSSVIIGLFIGAGLLAIVFVALQIHFGDKAMLPPRILKNRTVWSCSIFAFFFTADFFLLTYYIPIYFQSIKGSSAIHSAVQLLPFMIAVIISSIVTGGLVTKLGRYVPILWAGIPFLVIGTGLITTWRVDTGHAKWISYQVIMGLGTGGSFNIPLTAIQASLPIDDIPIGSACISFAQTLGGAIGVAIAQSLFVNNLTKSLHETVPNLSVTAITGAGATGFRGIVSATDLPFVIQAYMNGLVSTYRTGLVASCIGIIFVAMVPFYGTVKTGEENIRKESKAAPVEV
ncbi:protein of unknown function [Taphrina deformans PYCC 5710]|uniref:Major facilitator superfamily (MFS) profile domain-containing protein n=1 Tax=Taphrina deformans (strain PYCC 5710 / ATCC 11124 / CBS 356.35 / IMI 108563 / JCM 9778 / NBRC 8474) TaxID=1097556 RepID=R4XDW6_TAPDE|nr:protein of unknown function [Taphrina deformans PYCC 5710]|eukprot:CCG83837.1 protein of unknown function [Taphrina deformans PYCC 5710]